MPFSLLEHPKYSKRQSKSGSGPPLSTLIFLAPEVSCPNLMTFKPSHFQEGLLNLLVNHSLLQPELKRISLNWRQHLFATSKTSRNSGAPEHFSCPCP